MPDAPTIQARHARAAVAAVFLTNGALFANVVPRYPAIKAELELSNAAWGTALAAFPLGALIAGLFAATLITRLRSSRMATMGIVALAIALFGVSLAPTVVALAAVFFVAGAIDSIVDVAQNAHALRVQRLYRRSIVNSFHGLWSVGSVIGGLMGAAAAGLNVPMSVHLAVAAALFSAVAIVAYRHMLPGPEDAERAQSATAADPNASGLPAPRGLRSVPRASILALAVLGLLAVSGALVEDAGSSWSAIYLSGSLGADAATAGMAFVALSVAMTIGRLTGDRAVDRYGQATVARLGGLLTAAGLGLALAVPTIPTTLIGFALAGLGVATLIPAAFQAADEVPGLPNGVGLTAVSWLLRVGFLMSPPLIGLIADATSLRVGLLLVVAGGMATFVLGGTLSGRRERHV